jgi:hypothetical protein
MMMMPFQSQNEKSVQRREKKQEVKRSRVQAFWQWIFANCTDAELKRNSLKLWNMNCDMGQACSRRCCITFAKPTNRTADILKQL